jgi:beta-ribofuranosylaminobenzene 5'-phosphate synthase
MLTTTPRVATKVAVTTGCRLHIGFTNLSEDVGRCYGSIGVALDSPGTTVVLRTHDALRVIGEEQEEQDQIEEYLRRFCHIFAVEPRVSVEIQERISGHVGLGSGTELALSVGVGMARVLGLQADMCDVASAVGRGRRSGIGVAAFQTGGFIIDAGHKKDPDGACMAPTVVFRRNFPSTWRFVVAIPGAKRGLNGPREERVFRALTPPVRISEEICRLTQLKLMPALVEEDIEEFGSALTAIDRKTGLYFESVQGGIYGESEAAGTIDVMLRAGAFGAGQSSWGPAVYGLVDEARLGRVESEVRGFMERRGMGGRVFVAKGRNRGAQIAVETEEL